MKQPSHFPDARNGRLLTHTQGDGGFRHEVRAGKRLLAHSGMDRFIEDFYSPLEEFADADYFATLERCGAGDVGGVVACDVEHAGLDLPRVRVTWRVLGDRFCDGLLVAYAENGFRDRCLMRLKDLDRG